MYSSFSSILDDKHKPHNYSQTPPLQKILIVLNLSIIKTLNYLI
ncbi:hypothetical protein B4083_3733 [Bacillus cereus]|nr:hypothetical protein B4083_3733 [Bacillus cereus]